MDIKEVRQRTEAHTHIHTHTNTLERLPDKLDQLAQDMGKSYSLLNF